LTAANCSISNLLLLLSNLLSFNSGIGSCDAGENLF
jgi:hypothetical protein